MAKLQLAPPSDCTCRVPLETDLGWERAAYIALEAMQDTRFRVRRTIRPHRR